MDYFLDFWVIFDIFGQILRFLIKITCFLRFLREKWCRIIVKFRQKPYFEPKTCKIQPKVVIWTCPDLKSPDLDMSGPEKSWSGHVRTWKVVICTCPDLSRRTSTYFKTAEILFFWDFTPFHFLWPVLTSNHRKYFYFFRFYTFPFFISKFIIFL